MLIIYASNGFAANYSLPADLANSPFNCTGSGTTYTCNNNISISKESRITLTSNVTLNINGNLYINKQFEVKANGFNFNVNVTGNVEIDKEVDFTGNITADGNVIIDKEATFVGNIIAGGNIDIAKEGDFTGNLTADGNLDLAKKTTVDGICTPSHTQCTGVGNPSVNSIDRADVNPSTASSVSWTVIFSESVTGVNISDFTLITTGSVAGVSILSVSGSADTWTVVANTGTGSGTLGLNLVDDDTIINSSSKPLGGSGSVNGDFTGQVYTIVAAPAVNHYAITHSGIGVTCEAELVTITAHNADHSLSNVTSDTAVTITSNPVVDAITSSPVTILSGQSSATFTITESSVTTMPHIDINVSDGSATETSGSADASDDPALAFVDTLFQFVADTSSPPATSITTQIAGKPSSTAPDTQNLYLRAVRTDNTTGSQVCVTALDVGTHNIDMGYQCLDTDNCSVDEVSVTNNLTYNSGASTTIAHNDGAIISNTLPVTLNFDSSGYAPLSFLYNNVGKITLFAGDYITASGGTISSGISDQFIVRPFAFDIDVGLQRADDWLDGVLDGTGPSGIDASWSDNAGGRVFVKAGDNFNVTVRSVVWEAADDTDDNDGVADAGSNLTNNALTSNFGNELVSELVDITHTKVLPSEAGTVEGILSGGGNISLSNGTLTTALSWDEVGIIDLTASLDSGDYLASGSNVVATHQNFGRFYPDRFELSGIAPVLTNRIDESCMVPSTFTYMGENFQLAYEISAMNSDGNPTQNYTTTSGFAKLDNTQLDITAVDLTIPINFPVRLNVLAGLVDFVAGKTVNQIDSLSLDRLATGPDEAFELSVGIDPVDSDGVKFSAYNLDVVGADGIADHVLIGSTFIYYGRISMANSFGSEFSPQTIAIRTDYYDSATSIFIANSNDFCTTYDASLDIDLTLATYTSPLVASDLALTGSSTLLNGVGSFSLHDNVNPAAGPGVTGEVTYELSVPAYLQFNWDGVAGDENPSATATFGIYSGDSKQIFYRQDYQ